MEIALFASVLFFTAYLCALIDWKYKIRCHPPGIPYDFNVVHERICVDSVERWGLLKYRGNEPPVERPELESKHVLIAIFKTAWGEDAVDVSGLASYRMKMAEWFTTGGAWYVELYVMHAERRKRCTFRMKIETEG